jgi:hypothetical protein
MLKISEYGKVSSADVLVAMLALLPITGPYSLPFVGIALPDAIALFMVGFSLLKKRCLILYKDLVYLLGLLVLGGAVGTVIAMTSGPVNVVLAVKVFIVFILYMIMGSSFWSQIEGERFISVAVTIGVVAAILCILQFVFVSIGFTNFYSGKLPLPINKYSMFGSLIDITGTVRAHSFFEEPSYLAIYEIPVAAYCLQKGKYVQLAIVVSSCLLSATLLGLAGLFVVFISSVCFSQMKMANKIKLFFVAAMAVMIILLLANYNENVGTLFKYYTKRLLNVFDFSRDTSSSSQRIIGNLFLFERYGLGNQLLGVGVNQYPVYFNLATDYSNDFVTTLLNYGIFGVIILIGWIINLFRKGGKEGFVYIAFFLFVLMFDHIWFNEYFFYLLTWVYLFSKKKSGTIELRV